MPAIQLQHLKGFLVSCTSFLAVPLERLPLNSQQYQRAPLPEVQPHLVTTVWSPSAPQGPLNDTCCWCHAEMVGSTGQAFKSRVGAECRQVAKQSEVGYIPLLPTNESILCIKPLPYYLNFFILLKALHRRLLTHRMKPDVANWFWIATAHLKRMLCSSMLGLPAQFLLARAMFQIRRKFTLWNLFEVGKISIWQPSQ